MRLVRALFALVVCVGVTYELPASPQDDLPLKNWLPALPSWSDNAAGQSKERIQPMALPSAASHFIALSPCRVVDTRGADGSHGGPMLPGGAARAFNITTGPCAGIPIAAAYSLNIAVTGSTPGSIQFLAAYPAATARPLVATMNFDGGETTSNSALVPADANGAIEIYASTDTHLIIDINGYLKEGVVTSVAAGAGLAGGGTGSVSLSVADGGIGADQLGASAVTNGAIQDGAVTGPKIAANQVVKEVNGLRNSVSIAGAGGTTVSTAGSTITVSSLAAAVPSGTIILGLPNDTTIISTGYAEIGPSTQEIWMATSVTNAPSARLRHTAIWTGTRMIVWAGDDGTGGGGSLNTGGQYDPLTDSWSATSLVDAPSARTGHVAVWTGTRMIVWGGAGTSLWVNTGGQYDPVENSWIETNTFGAPAARNLFSAVWTSSVMIVWGGNSSTGVLNTGALYRPEENDWAPMETANAPSARKEFAAVWTGSKMVVWGGADSLSLLNTGGRYDPGTNTWLPTSTSGAPAGRSYHTAVWTGSEMVVWGGFVPGGVTNTGGRYNPGTDAWRAASTDQAPAQRYWHSAVWTGEKMIIWGGQDFVVSIIFANGGLYDPFTDKWTSMIADATARQLHSAVWDQQKKRMIVWGGQNSTGLQNTGAQWTVLSLYRKN